VEVLVTPVAVTNPRFPDLVPRELREQWKAAGYYPGIAIFGMFNRHVDRQPDAQAVVDAEGSVSFAELRRLALRLAAGLLWLGVAPGDVVAYQLPNSRLCCAIDLAVVAIEAIVLPFPPGRGDQNVRSLLRRSRAVVVIVEDHYDDVDLVEMVTAIVRELPDPCQVVVHGSAERGGLSNDCGSSTNPSGCCS
jgi:acyl-CoA synthetase